MKRLAIIAITCCLGLVLTACGDKDKPVVIKTEVKTDAPATESQDKAQDKTEVKTDVKTDNGQSH
jgi:hypothetical protein